MEPAASICRVDPTLAVWEAYQPSIKVGCTTTALRLASGEWLIIDPIPIKAHLLSDLLQGASIHAIVLTSGNHQRSSLELQETLSVPIFAPALAFAELKADRWYVEETLFEGCCRMFALPGGALGESALLVNNLLVVGDSLVHLDGYLQILPEKYCQNLPVLRQSLRRLLDVSFARICFAHGQPILHSALSRLAGLLDQ